MIRRVVPLLGLLCLCAPLLGQKLGDQYTAGYTPARTYANNDLTDFKPPLGFFETINLTGISDATSLAVFEDQFLVGQGGTEITYRLFNRAGSAEWTQTMTGLGGTLNYVPSMAGDLLILGSESTTSIRAVSASTGSMIWSDSAGNTSGRFPLVTDSLAIYAGAAKIVARQLDGTVIWQQTATTTGGAAVAEAPLAMWGNSLYFVSGSGNFQGVRVSDGAPLWAGISGGQTGSSLIATEKHLFVTIPGAGLAAAISTSTGEVAWSQTVPGPLSTNPGIALGNGRLFVFRSDDGSGVAGVDARNPETGELLWSVNEDGPGISFGFVADKVVYYYHEATDRIRARDASTGTLLWSIKRSGVRALAAHERELAVLLASSIRIYVPQNQIYMAQMANGGGQTTLVTLSNPAPSPVAATVEFLDNDGDPLSVPMQGGTVHSVDISVPANGSVKVQTLDAGGSVAVGWVRVTSDGLLRAASIFQFSSEGQITREAGVADSLATGSANVFVKYDGVFDTGVALVNPTGEQAAVTLRLLDDTGIQLGDPVEFDLPAGGHVASFVSELFPDEVGTSFEGSLVIESNIPVAITALRTKNGIQLSSYPVGQAVR